MTMTQHARTCHSTKHQVACLPVLVGCPQRNQLRSAAADKPLSLIPLLSPACATLAVISPALKTRRITIETFMTFAILPSRSLAEAVSLGQPDAPAASSS